MSSSQIDQQLIDMVDELTDHLVLEDPPLRVQVVAAARARLADGRHPTALDLAGTLVAYFA